MTDFFDSPHFAARFIARHGGEVSSEVKEKLKLVTLPIGFRDFSVNNYWNIGLIAKALGDNEFAHWQKEVAKTFPENPFLQIFSQVFSTLSFSSLAALALSHGGMYYKAGEDDPAAILSENSTFCEFALRHLQWAEDRLTSIRSGETEYIADKAFTVEEAHSIALCARVSSLQSPPKSTAQIARILKLTSLAPTAANTLPSQSLAIALGHTIEAAPLPETLTALQEVIASIRHAGVKKKLERNIKSAQRALAERPDLALLLLPQLKPGKKSSTLFSRFLEAGFLTDNTFSLHSWQENMLNTKVGSSVANKLIWMITTPDGYSTALIPEKNGYRDSEGKSVVMPTEGDVRLWHPLHADEEERSRWQRQIQNHVGEQPFRQAFRETGYGHSPALFADYWLNLMPCIGLARTEGWRTSYGELERRFGQYFVRFSISANIYPGAEGIARSGNIDVLDPISNESMQLENLPAVVCNEIMRAVDLLVSVSAVDTGPEPANAMIVSTRREKLMHDYAQALHSGQLMLEGSHIKCGNRSLHLNTGIESENGVILSTPADRDRCTLGQRLNEVIARWNRC